MTLDRGRGRPAQSHQSLGFFAVGLGVLGCITGTGVTALIALALGLKLRHDYRLDPDAYKRDLGTPALVLGVLGLLVFLAGLGIVILTR
jgi:hypothetical protein